VEGRWAATGAAGLGFWGLLQWAKDLGGFGVGRRPGQRACGGGVAGCGDGRFEGGVWRGSWILGGRGPGGWGAIAMGKALGFFWRWTATGGGGLQRGLVGLEVRGWGGVWSGAGGLGGIVGVAAVWVAAERAKGGAGEARAKLKTQPPAPRQPNPSPPLKAQPQGL
jgi:hypothetical protein